MASGARVRDNLPKFAGRVSMTSHVEELRGAVRALAAELPEGRDRLFALTSSEGAIHTVNYQLGDQSPHFHGLVLTGAPGRAIARVTRDQFVEAGRHIPNASAILQSYDAAIDQFMAAKEVTIDPSLPEPVKFVLRSLITPANLPFSRELWGYDLARSLPRVREPVLVVIGKKDLQTDWRADGGALERAAGPQTNFTFVYPEDANHVLKHEERAREELPPDVAVHYNDARAVLDAAAVRAISAWLGRQCG